MQIGVERHNLHFNLDYIHTILPTKNGIGIDPIRLLLLQTPPL